MGVSVGVAKRPAGGGGSGVGDGLAAAPGLLAAADDGDTSGGASAFIGAQAATRATVTATDQPSQRAFVLACPLTAGMLPGED